MQVTVGKHKGKSVKLLVLKDPDYVHWLFGENVSGPLLAVKNQAQQLINRFDAKPIQKQCYSSNCSSSAIRATVYGNNISPYWWCANCDPYQSGANNGKLQVLRTYSDALSHVVLYCASRKSDFREIIKEFAEAKGLPKRVGEQQCAAFFQ
jgi:hypothetical protein